MEKFNVLDLKNYSFNEFSQWGEDGVINKILEIINKTDSNRWCVEFGAWDGIYLSNTCNLIKNHNFSSVLIEADKNKYKELCNNFPSESVFKICRYVDFEGKNSLENILSETPIPKNFDFLSIDIDGCDYFIFDSLKDYRPKIICIEYNPTIPNEVEFTQDKNFSLNQGSSALSILNLAIQKNYFLAHVTYSNLIFVSNDFDELFENTKLDLDAHRNDKECKNFIFFGYDGSLISNKKEFHLRWHDLYFNVKEIQFLPKLLRKYKGSHNLVDKINFALFLLIKKPSVFFKKIISKFKKNNNE